MDVLDLCHNKLISDEWCHHVQMNQLRVLYLSSCGVNDTVCVSLMISLSKHCPMLGILKLNDNNMISTEWCHHVQMKQLRVLDLSRCGVNDTVCVSLMISLSKHCPLLRILKLNDNDLISTECRPVHPPYFSIICMDCKAKYEIPPITSKFRISKSRKYEKSQSGFGGLVGKQT